MSDAIRKHNWRRAIILYVRTVRVWVPATDAAHTANRCACVQSGTHIVCMNGVCVPASMALVCVCVCVQRERAAAPETAHNEWSSGHCRNNDNIRIVYTTRHRVGNTHGSQESDAIKIPIRCKCIHTFRAACVSEINVYSVRFEGISRTLNCSGCSAS